MKHIRSRLSHPVRSLAASLTGRSYLVRDQRLHNRFVGNPENTFLVSFPRTGSHWLRMMMELYFERPSLVRVFYFPRRTDYLTLHTHDLDLALQRTHVIYLYRRPIDTIYSQLRYHGQLGVGVGPVEYWTDLYGRHLDKWLLREGFTKIKTILTYEEMVDDVHCAFAKIANHFGYELDQNRLELAYSRVTKSHVQNRTSHDPRVVSLDQSPQVSRDEFGATYGELVWGTLLDGRPHLLHVFDTKPAEYQARIK